MIYETLDFWDLKLCVFFNILQKIVIFSFVVSLRIQGKITLPKMAKNYLKTLSIVRDHLRKADILLMPRYFQGNQIVKSLDLP